MADDDLDDMNLTDEERAALAEPDPADEPATAEADGDEGADPDAPDGDDEGDGGGDEGEEAAADPEPKPEEPEPATAKAKDDDLPPPAAIFTDADKARLEAIEAEKDALYTKFDEGELSAAEMKAQMKALDTEDRLLTVRKSETERYEKEFESRWESDVKGWMADHAEVRTAIAVPANLESFDKIVRAYTGSALSDGLSNAEILDRALDEFKRRNPDVFPDDGAKPKAKEHPADAARRKNPPKAPPTLARIPASDIIDTGEGKAAALDNLARRDPLAHEEQLLRMSEAERDRYLQAS